MADLTISFLFILMILLAFFASRFNVSDTVARDEYDRLKDELRLVQKTVNAPDLRVAAPVEAMKEELDRLRARVTPEGPNPMEIYNSAVAETRKKLLRNLRDEINARIKGLDVQISANFDALQLSGAGLFESGREIPTPAGSARMRQIAQILGEYLGCYALGPGRTFSPDCNDAYALIDALQVEGHTDNLGGDNLNMDLSAKRAASIYALMTEQRPDLILYSNREAQPILSVAGYGKGRPIQTNDSTAGRDANRRIDLRFIMVVPSKEADISSIKRALSEGP
ncbi:OmpA family protein [Phyllobacterium sophorae]|nr:OmpA family protein [Phyllobacterium sophorae]